MGLAGASLTACGGDGLVDDGDTSYVGSEGAAEGREGARLREVRIFRFLRALSR